MQELEKILKKIEKLKKMYKESSLSLIDKGNFPCEYDKSDIESAKMQAISEAITIIRKHMNDDWIPVDDRLPEVFGKYWATIRYDDGRISEPIVVDFRGVRQKYVVNTPNGREYETWGIDSAFHGSRVIAWRPYYIPEPYKPKPQNKPEDHYPEWRTKFLGKFDKRV